MVSLLTRKEYLKTNAAAQKDCRLYLTKPLGIGIMSTAQKKGVLSEDDFKTARQTMLKLNSIGFELGKLNSVKAVTDVTGFGLLGHCIEMCKASKLSAEIIFENVATLPNLEKYIEMQAFPGGMKRNFESYGHHVTALNDNQKAILCDPQTSGGLLIAAENDDHSFLELLKKNNLSTIAIGKLTEPKDYIVSVL